MSKKYNGRIQKIKHRDRYKINNNIGQDIIEDKKKRFNTIKFNERQGNHDKALSLINEYLNDYPNEYRVLDYKALVLLKLRRIDESKQLLFSFLDNRDISKRDYIFGRFVLAKAYVYEGDLESAKIIYEEGIAESDYLEIKPRTELSRIYCEENDYYKAFKILEIPGFNNETLNLQRARIKCSMGNYRGAIKEFDREIIIDDGDNRNIEKYDEKFYLQDKYYLIGHCLFNLKDYDNALKYLNMSLTYKTRSSYTKSIIDILKIKLDIGLLDDVISLGEDTLTINNIISDHEIIIRRLVATAYSKKQRYQKAEELYKNTDENKKEMVNYSKILIAKGDFEEAERILSNYYDLDNIKVEDDFDGTYRYAFTKFKLNRYSDFLKLYEAYISYEGLSNVAKKNIVYLKRMKLLLDIKNNITIEDREYTYSEKQIINYDRDLAVDHVIDHHVINPTYNYFKPDVDISKLFEEILPLLDKKYLHYNGVFDNYIIRYNDIGYDDDGVINEMIVITIPETTNIITMYPSRGLDNFDVEEEDKNVKKHSKRLSQIDKFNKKYNINNE